MTVIRRYSFVLAFALSAGGGRTSGFALATETTTGSQPVGAEARPREPVIGIGYHVGNFIGPLAFDIIVRPVAHIAIDVQAGYSSEGVLKGNLRFAPHLQWEFWRGLQTPYLGLAFRYERVWLDGAAAAGTGGFLVGGWQIRWKSGLGVLFGVGILYMTSIDVRAPTSAYYSQGGLFGTYEVGLRYFF